MHRGLSQRVHQLPPSALLQSVKQKLEIEKAAEGLARAATGCKVGACGRLLGSLPCQAEASQRIHHCLPSNLACPATCSVRPLHQLLTLLRNPGCRSHLNPHQAAAGLPCLDLVTTSSEW